MVVALREVHALGILPSKVSDQTERRQHDDHCPEPWIGEQTLNDANVFVRDVDHWCHCRIDGHKDEPQKEGSWDGKNGVLGPDVGDETGLQEDGGQIGGVGSGAPCPVTSISTIPLRPVIQDEGLSSEVENKRVIEAVCDPRPE